MPPISCHRWTASAGQGQSVPHGAFCGFWGKRSGRIARPICEHPSASPFAITALRGVAVKALFLIDSIGYVNPTFLVGNILPLATARQRLRFTAAMAMVHGITAT
jgi:hypothetical protein